MAAGSSSLRRASGGAPPLIRVVNGGAPARVQETFGGARGNISFLTTNGTVRGVDRTAIIGGGVLQQQAGVAGP